MKELSQKDLEQVNGGVCPCFLVPLSDGELGGITGDPAPGPFPPGDIRPNPIPNRAFVWGAPD